MTACPHCGRPLAGTICPVHGDTSPARPPMEFPVGGIIMWSGSESKVPFGWALCNGQNGTPDLRDKFIVGAGNTYAVAATGGSNAAHSHSVSMTSSGSVSGTTSSDGVSAHSGTAVEEHSRHVHSVSGTTGNVKESISPFPMGTSTNISRAPANHTHDLTGTAGVNLSGGAATTHSVTQPSDHEAHSHTLSTASVSGSATSGTASSMPSYYALALIMRVA